MDQERTKRKNEAINFKKKFAEIDMSVDIKDQPIQFAQWYSDTIFERTVEQLKIDGADPEVIRQINETYDLQRQILEQSKMSSDNRDTYITI